MEFIELVIGFLVAAFMRLYLAIALLTAGPAFPESKDARAPQAEVESPCPLGLEPTAAHPVAQSVPAGRGGGGAHTLAAEEAWPRDHLSPG
jgi:hypothetical protein